MAARPREPSRTSHSVDDGPAAGIEATGALGTGHMSGNSPLLAVEGGSLAHGSRRRRRRTANRSYSDTVVRWMAI